ncbi:MAG: hypothetical protein RUMPE_00206 [Eubacteriales bacterium SKADARSKE-1]|nr:hypothetical protein [Eubacteriales bacterium SKADARSKE-1]
MKIGLDIGSTTIKCVIINENNEIVYKSYERHYSQIKQKLIDILSKVKKEMPESNFSQIAISGSAGMGIAEKCGVQFVQEVYATRTAANVFAKGTDVIIELGGEDAKILFLTGGLEVRMNGSCAGGTGAFIDQMATLLAVPIDKMNDLSMQYEKTYTIASRCGVFAKSDIQPLLNQGAKKSDIAKSIFMAVVNQTIAGLSQGRKICGNVLYLGGPLTFMNELRKSFDETLSLVGNCPENSLYYVALGAAIGASETYSLDGIVQKVENYKSDDAFAYNNPLFKDEKEYEEFKDRHQKSIIKKGDIENYSGDVYLGVDAGSTTVKAVIIGENNELLYSKYLPNNGDLVPVVKSFLEEIFEKYPNLNIKSSAATGYGEELIKNAFSIDFGIVETVAHLIAAKKFMPDVEFIIDIGGQDIKCFKVRNGVIDNIFLNEACSSGCGSFLQTFANALGYSISDFAQLGLFAKKPVDLGSRCTVFMNSSVKQAQKDGAYIEDISAGLSLSIVKNALYKVIRAGSPDELGKKIVVQGGTFLNDAVLRAFEQEIMTNVIRPDISGLMGAYGAALYAKKKAPISSAIIKKDELKNLIHEVKSTLCNGCSNHCKLTINIFSKDKKYISGNRCEKPTANKESDDRLNMYAYKLGLLKQYGDTKGERETIGIPMGLNMFELLPFWHKFFTELGFGIKVSPPSSSELYMLGQHTIPSDTICFPAKLMHGHVEALMVGGIKTIFYPCMSYNFDEGLGDNHYNCPVVAYYPEVITANFKDIKNITFIKDYVGIHKEKEFPKKIYKILSQHFDNIQLIDVMSASRKAYKEYDNYIKRVREKGQEIINFAEKENRQIIVLSGRPYHIDPEINHGIDKLILSFGAAIISEDVVSGKEGYEKINVLNQWTYHSRLYSAAKYIKDKKNMNLVQLVSFGCGIDAITTDEVRDILEKEGKIYTQLKIDEITNLGAIKIRLRSLFATL